MRKTYNITVQLLISQSELDKSYQKIEAHHERAELGSAQ